MTEFSCLLSSSRQFSIFADSANAANNNKPENVLPIGCYRPRPCALRRLRPLAGVGLCLAELLPRPLRHPRGCRLRTSGQHLQPRCRRGMNPIFLFSPFIAIESKFCFIFHIRTTKSVCTPPTNGPALLAPSPRPRAHLPAACSSTSSDTLPETTLTVIDSFFVNLFLRLVC